MGVTNSTEYVIIAHALSSFLPDEDTNNSPLLPDEHLLLQKFSHTNGGDMPHSNTHCAYKGSF